MKLNREVGGGIQRVKKNIYKRTGVSNTRFRQKNEDGGWYVGLCNGKSIIYKLWR